MSGMNESQGDLPFFAVYEEVVYVVFVLSAIEVYSGEGKSKAFWKETRKVEVTDLCMLVLPSDVMNLVGRN